MRVLILKEVDLFGKRHLVNAEVEISPGYGAQLIASGIAKDLDVSVSFIPPVKSETVKLVKPEPKPPSAPKNNEEDTSKPIELEQAEDGLRSPKRRLKRS